MLSCGQRSYILKILMSIFVIALTAALCVGVIGCETEKKTTKPYNPTPAVTPQPEPEPEPIPPAPPQPSGIPWDEAKYHIGERTTVYGPVASTKWATGSRGQPTFINLGNAYPNTNRFQAIIWVQNRGNFPFAPESYYSGKTISVTGLIVDYEGIPEIEVTSPSQIEVW